MGLDQSYGSSAHSPDDIVCQEATQLRLCDASGISTRVMWLKITRSGKIIMWNHPCPYDITDSLVLETNSWGTLSNYNLDLSAIIIHKSTLLAALHEAIMTAPRSISDNTPNISWINWESYTINPVVVDLLHTHELSSRQFLLNPLVFYHYRQGNLRADDASFLFILPNTSFLSHMYST